MDRMDHPGVFLVLVRIPRGLTIPNKKLNTLNLRIMSPTRHIRKILCRSPASRLQSITTRSPSPRISQF